MILTANERILQLKEEKDTMEFLLERQISSTMISYYKKRIRFINKDIKYYESMPKDRKIVLGPIKTADETEIVFGKSN